MRTFKDFTQADTSAFITRFDQIMESEFNLSNTARDDFWTLLNTGITKAEIS